MPPWALRAPSIAERDSVSYSVKFSVLLPFTVNLDLQVTTFKVSLSALLQMTHFFATRKPAPQVPVVMATVIVTETAIPEMKSTGSNP